MCVRCEKFPLIKSQLKDNFMARTGCVSDIQSRGTKYRIDLVVVEAQRRGGGGVVTVTA